jgi:hypothetical protein
MHRQKTLPLDDQEPLEALWERFPEAHRRERHRSYAALRLPASFGHGSGSPCP